MLWDLIEVVRVPDVRHREEVSFYLIPDGVLIVGDLLSGGRKDCGIQSFLPPLRRSPTINTPSGIR